MRTKLGSLMFNLTNKLAKPLSKSRFLYYFLNFTWGIVMTFMGLLITLVLLISGKKPKKHERVWYFEVGEYWGGVNFGVMFLAGKDPSKGLKSHEYGHSFQNAIFGPLFPLLIGIPSMIRYWYREIIWRTNREKYRELPKYDDIWFEGSATDIGKKYTEL